MMWTQTFYPLLNCCDSNAWKKKIIFPFQTFSKFRTHVISTLVNFKISNPKMVLDKNCKMKYNIKKELGMQNIKAETQFYLKNM